MSIITCVLGPFLTTCETIDFLVDDYLGPFFITEGTIGQWSFFVFLLDISKNYLRPSNGLGRPRQRKVRPAAAAFDLQHRTKSLDAVATRVITGTSHLTVLLFLHLFLQQRPVFSLLAPRIPTSRCHTPSPGKMQTSLGVRPCDYSQKSTLFLNFIECMSTSTVYTDRRQIVFLYERTHMVDIDQFLGTMNRTDRRYRP